MPLLPGLRGSGRPWGGRWGGGGRGGGGGWPPVSLENVMLSKRSTKTSWSQFSSRIKIAVAQDCIVFLLTSVLNKKIFQLFLSMCHITFCICDQFPITIFVCVLWKPGHWVDHRENVKQRKCNYFDSIRVSTSKASTKKSFKGKRKSPTLPPSWVSIEAKW